LGDHCLRQTSALAFLGEPANQLARPFRDVLGIEVRLGLAGGHRSKVYTQFDMMRP